MDKRINNGGHSTKGFAGRKSKAYELSLMDMGLEAIEQAYGTQENYWLSIAEKSKNSIAHLRLLTEYIYGKPQTKVDITSNSEKVNIPVFHWFTTEE